MVANLASKEDASKAGTSTKIDNYMLAQKEMDVVVIGSLRKMRPILINDERLMIQMKNKIK